MCALLSGQIVSVPYMFSALIVASRTITSQIPGTSSQSQIILRSHLPTWQWLPGKTVTIGIADVPFPVVFLRVPPVPDRAVAGVMCGSYRSMRRRKCQRECHEIPHDLRCFPGTVSFESSVPGLRCLPMVTSPTATPVQRRRQSGR